MADFEQIVVKVGARRHTGPAARRRPRRDRAGDPARGVGPGRPRRHRRRHRRHAARRERAQRDQPGQGPARRIEGLAAGGRRDRDDVRPLGPDRAGHRDASARADDRDDHRVAGDPRLPLAHPVGGRADRDDPGVGAAGVHPDVLPRRDGQHHVAGRDRHLDRRAGGRGDRRGGERVQQAASLAGRRAEGRLPRGAARGAEGSRAVGVLLAARHRRRLPARLRARGPGRPSLQAARVFEEPRDGDRRGAGHHAGSGDADALHPHGPVQLPAALALLAGRPRSWSARTTRRSAIRSAARSSRCTTRPAGWCCGSRRPSSCWRSRRCWPRSRPTGSSARSSCRR